MHPIEPPTRVSSRRIRVPVLGSVAIIIALGLSGASLAASPGESAFNTTCIACHTIGGGRLIGPDLAGVTDRRSESWLIEFIRSSQSVIASGDPVAVGLAEEYAGMMMPDAGMSDQQLKDIVSYLSSINSAASSGSVAGSVDSATGGSTTVSTPIAPQEPATEEEIVAGQNYFQGQLRFENNGAACNACHDVRNDAIIGGGILAAELTTVFSRMGGSGVRAILGRAPFPVMQAAYKDKPLTEAEVTALVAFLEYADSEEYNQLPRDYGIGLFVTGTAGAALLFAFFGVFWRGRKIGSVNQAIYDRQIKSEPE